MFADKEPVGISVPHQVAAISSMERNSSGPTIT